MINEDEEEEVEDPVQEVGVPGCVEDAEDGGWSCGGGGGGCADGGDTGG